MFKKIKKLFKRPPIAVVYKANKKPRKFKSFEKAVAFMLSK